MIGMVVKEGLWSAFTVLIQDIIIARQQKPTGGQLFALWPVKGKFTWRKESIRWQIMQGARDSYKVRMCVCPFAFVTHYRLS